MKWYNDDSSDIIFKIFFFKTFEYTFCIAMIYKLDVILHMATYQLDTEKQTIIK